MKIVMPMNGKMSISCFGTSSVLSQFERNNVELKRVVRHAINREDSKFLSSSSLDEEYEQLIRRTKFLRACRRFCLKSSSRELKFSDFIATRAFSDLGRKNAFLFGQLAIQVISRNKILSEVCHKTERWMAPQAKIMKFLLDSGADRILSPSIGNYGFEWECYFSWAAEKLRIPRYAVVTNFDNLTNRGYRGFSPDRLGVWGKQMADDAMRLHKLPASRIEKIGFAGFDQYFQEPDCSRVEFHRKVGLNPKLPTIMYAGSITGIQTLEVLMHIKTRFGSEVNLIFRPYPHRRYWNDPVAPIVNEFVSTFENLYVGSFTPTVFDCDIPHFINTCQLEENLDKAISLRYSDVLINHYSTMALEAALVDVPVIQVGFTEGRNALNPKYYPEFLSLQSHHVRQLKAGASVVASSPAQLTSEIAQFLDNRSISITLIRSSRTVSTVS